MNFKNYFLMATILIAIDLQLAGCSSSEKSPFAPPTPVTDRIAEDQKTLILKAENSLKEKKAEEALVGFDAYLKKYPLSAYTAQAQMGRGRSLELLKKYDEAVLVYRLIGEQARTYSPAQAGVAYVRLAGCYEVLGDEGRLQLALKDALSFGEALPEDIRFIEIPTRQAASELRRGDAEAAHKLLRQVESRLPNINSQSSAEAQDRQADVLLRMGTLNLAGLTPETYLPLLESFDIMQRYLWRSVLMNRAASAEALSKLQKSYEQFSALAISPPKTVASGQDPAVVERAYRELQRKWLSRLLEATQNLNTYAEDDIKDTSAEFAAQLAKIESTGEKILRRSKGITPVTPESRARNSIKREGKTISKPFFENEKAAVPAAPVQAPANSEDPNLKKIETDASEKAPDYRSEDKPENP